MRVAAITYSSDARVAFDFEDHAYDSGAIAAALDTLTLKGDSPTFAHTAFRTLRTELLTMNGARGFRRYAAPVVLVLLSDGETRVPEFEPSALTVSARHPFWSFCLKCVIGIPTSEPGDFRNFCFSSCARTVCVCSFVFYARTTGTPSYWRIAHLTL